MKNAVVGLVVIAMILSGCTSMQPIPSRALKEAQTQATHPDTAKTARRHLLSHYLYSGKRIRVTERSGQSYLLVVDQINPTTIYGTSEDGSPREVAITSITQIEVVKFDVVKSLWWIIPAGIVLFGGLTWLCTQPEATGCI